MFRTTPGTRLESPGGRFGARGRLAGEFTRDVPWDDYYGPGEDYFTMILRAYLATRAPPRARVAQAAGEILDARALVRLAARWMTEHFRG